jgi:hypothetical protein
MIVLSVGHCIPQYLILSGIVKAVYSPAAYAMCSILITFPCIVNKYSVIWFEP